MGEWVAKSNKHWVKVRRILNLYDNEHSLRNFVTWFFLVLTKTIINVWSFFLCLHSESNFFQNKQEIISSDPCKVSATVCFAMFAGKQSKEGVALEIAANNATFINIDG